MEFYWLDTATDIDFTSIKYKLVDTADSSDAQNPCQINHIIYGFDDFGSKNLWLKIKNQTRLTWKVKFDNNFNERR